MTISTTSSCKQLYIELISNFLSENLKIIFEYGHIFLGQIKISEKVLSSNSIVIISENTFVLVYSWELVMEVEVKQHIREEDFDRNRRLRSLIKVTNR